MWCEIIERTAVYVYNKDIIPSSTEYVLHEFQPKQLSQLFFYPNNYYTCLYMFIFLKRWPNLHVYIVIQNFHHVPYG